MLNLTLFVDESGIFEPRGRVWPVGQRLVGGVALPGDAVQAEKSAEQILARALQAAGIPWWSSEVSGKFFLHAPDLAERLASMPGVPERFATLAGAARRSSQERERLREIGRQWLASIRFELGRQLQALDARVLLVGEYGAPGWEANPVADPYRRMLAALLGQSAVWAATQWQAHRLEWVLAHRPGIDLVNLPYEPWRRALERAGERSHARAVDLREPQVHGCAERAGLQVADLVVHALGPGRKHQQPLCPETAALRTKERVCGLLASILRFEGGWAAEQDASCVAMALCDWLGASSTGAVLGRIVRGA